MIAEKLRAANIVVIEGRPVGRTTGVQSIDVRWTDSRPEDQGAPDLNGVVAQQVGAFYIERGGRVWMLAQGPRGGQLSALVFMAGSEDDATDEQTDTLAALLAILGDVYALDAATPEPDPEPEPETEESE